MKNAVDIKNLNFRWIKGVNISVKRGSIALIIDSERITSMGIMNILAGALPIPRGADIRCFGSEVRDGKRIGYMPPFAEIEFGLTVRRQLIKWSEALGLSDAEKSVEKIIKELEMEDFSDERIDEITYSRRLWVVFASSMIFNPDLILVNHTMDNFDMRNREKFTRIITMLNRRYGKTVLIASNEYDDCLKMAERVWVINKRKVVEIEDEMTVEKTKRYIRIQGRPLGKVAVLMEKMNLTYFVEDRDSILVFDEKAQVSELVDILVEKGIKVDSIYEVKEGIADKVRRIIEYGHNR